MNYVTDINKTSLKHDKTDTETDNFKYLIYMLQLKISIFF